MRIMIEEYQNKYDQQRKVARTKTFEASRPLRSSVTNAEAVGEISRILIWRKQRVLSSREPCAQVSRSTFLFEKLILFGKPLDQREMINMLSIRISLVKLHFLLSIHECELMGLKELS